MKMRSLFVPVCLMAFALAADAQSFLQDQQRFPRVRDARDTQDTVLQRMFAQQGLPYPCPYIFLRYFKEEGQMEMWGRAQAGDAYTLVETYEICSASGDIGPKRRQGDYQVPEGFYKLNYFNPSSTFHLSMKVSYPNQADRRWATGNDPGGDIFIHGNCVSIGCLAMTTPKIKEIYWACAQAHGLGNTVYVHAMPLRLTDANWARLQPMMQDSEDLTQLWPRLKEGYDCFEQNQRLPSIQFTNRGTYLVNCN